MCMGTLSWILSWYRILLYTWSSEYSLIIFCTVPCSMYIFSIYSYRLWNILTISLTAIISHIHISLMFCHYISCIYSHRLWNILTILLTAKHFPYSYFPHVSSLQILYIQLQTLKYIYCIINCNIAPY